MITMRWRPALKYYLYQGMRALGVFFAVIIISMVVIPAVIALSLDGHTEVAFGGLGLGSVIMFLVLGIIVMRENIKLFLQNGCGRPTLFIADILGSLLLALMMAVICMLLPRIFTSVHIDTGLRIGEMLLFRHSSSALPTVQYALLHFCGLLLAWRVGMFISLIYYRLNLVGQVIISVAVPVLLIFGLSRTASAGPVDPSLFSRAFNWVIASPNNAILAALIAALLCTAASWPLLIKAQVRD